MFAVAYIDARSIKVRPEILKHVNITWTSNYVDGETLRETSM
jgi:hypothetical protein